MKVADSEHRIRTMAFLYARDEHNVTAAVEHHGYSVRITLHKRDGTDVFTDVNPRASVVEIHTAIDAAMKQKPQPEVSRPVYDQSLALAQMNAYAVTGTGYHNALLGPQQNALGQATGLDSLLGMYGLLGPFKSPYGR